jgi:hypothetical protein
MSDIKDCLLAREIQSSFWVHRQVYISRMIIFAVFFIFSELYSRGTSIAILYNSQEIVAAADSKAFGGPNVCKTYKIGNIYWAFSGRLNDPKNGYSVPEMVTRSYGGGHSVGITFGNFKKMSIASLTTELNDLYHQDRKGFETIRYHPLQIAFWAFERGRPVVAQVVYTSQLSGNRVSVKEVNESIDDCSVEDCLHNTRATALGVQGSMAAYASSHPNWTRNLVESARHFVEGSIGEAPKTVGPPISILVVKNDGSNWEQPTQYCRDGPAQPPAFYGPNHKTMKY